MTRRSGLPAAILLLMAFASGCAASPPKAALAPGAPVAEMSAQPRAADAASQSPAMEAAPAPQAEPAAASPSPMAARAAQTLPTTPAAGGSSHPVRAKQSTDSPKLDELAKPLLIYEGALGVQVDKSDLSGVLEKSIDVAEAHGGYLVSRTDTVVQLRVPSTHFRLALREIAALGDVTRRSVSAQDVSEQYHDLEVRLKNLEAVRNRLEQFLVRATNVDEALRVGKELENVVRQIDEAKGRMQFLKTRASYSLITLTLTPAPEKAPVVAGGGKSHTPPARPLRMPVKWLKKVGLAGLLEL